MSSSTEIRRQLQGSDCNAFWRGLARAVAGAILFCLPMLMTMEMWWLGFYMESYRLALFIAVNIFLLIGLERHRGFKHNDTWPDTIIDAFVGYAVGFATAALFLPVFGAIEPEMGAREIIGKTALQAVPASIGAILARSQFGQQKKGQSAQEQKMSSGWHYLYELVLMLAGALFVSLNMAPTEEIALIAYQITPWITLALVAISLLLMHAFVYNVGFHGQEEAPDQAGFIRIFFNYTIVGYVVVLGVSGYILWSFGRFEGESMYNIISTIIVLAVPGSLGAAAARLII